MEHLSRQRWLALWTNEDLNVLRNWQKSLDDKNHWTLSGDEEWHSSQGWVTVASSDWPLHRLSAGINTLSRYVDFMQRCHFHTRCLKKLSLFENSCGKFSSREWEWEIQTFYCSPKDEILIQFVILCQPEFLENINHQCVPNAAANLPLPKLATSLFFAFAQSICLKTDTLSIKQESNELLGTER